MLTSVGHFGNWDLWQNYHKVTFDGLNKLILVNEGVTTLDIKVDVFSDWKEWVITRDDNAFWLPAIRSVGGDPTVAGQTAGDIYFLQNGWKLYIDLTKVKVTGVLFSDDFDTAYYDYSGNAQFPAEVSSLVSGISATSSGGTTPADVWTYQSRTLTQQIASDAPTTAEIAQEVWTYLTRTLTADAAPTTAEIWSYSDRTLTTDAAPSSESVAAAVWNAANASYNTSGTFGHLLNEVDYLEKQIWVNTDAGTNGSGSQESPFNNINDAIDKAENDGIYVIDLIGDITLNRNFKNFKIKGIGNPEVNLNGQNTKNSTFCNVKVKGAFQEGSGCLFEDCEILDSASLEGTYDNCALLGDLTCQDTATVLMKDCVSGIAGTGRPTISMNSGGTSLLSVRGYNGGLTIKDCNNAADRVTVEMNPGSLTFDSSCTNGIMVARGVGKFVDNTAGASVTNETVNQSITDDVENSVSAVQTTVNTINTNLSTVDGLVRTVDTVVDGIATDLESISANILAVDVSSLSSNIAAVETKVDILTVNVNSANSAISNVDSDLERVENKIDILDINVDEIETIVRDIDVSDLNSLSSAIAAVQTSVDAIDTTSLSSSIAAVADDLESISTNILAINVSDLNTLSSAIATVQTSVDAINTDSLSAEIAAVQSSVDAINTDSLSAEIAAVQSAIDTTNTNVNTINTNVNTINTNVNSANSAISNVDSDLARVEGKVDTLDTNVLAIDTDTSSLSANILAVQTSVNAITQTASQQRLQRYRLP
jgi:predicted  nucleic acid-binding Zn-ribbon protein